METQPQGATLKKTQVRRWGTIDFVLIVVTAALYAASLLATLQFKLVPGTNLRPGNALQSLFGMLFGWPGIIGIVIGNVVNDLFHGAPLLAILVGVLANFISAWLPYMLVSSPSLKTMRSWIEFYVWVVLVTSGLVGASMYLNAWLGVFPTQVAATLVPVVFLNQAIPTAILTPLLIKLLSPYIKKVGLYRGRVQD